MNPGSVDPKTGNVPLRLDGDYAVHFEGRNADGSVLVRITRSTTSPVLGFSDAVDLHRYVSSLPAHLRHVTCEEVDEWLDIRAAEPAAS
jgi:hypothetical protein